MAPEQRIRSARSRILHISTKSSLVVIQGTSMILLSKGTDVCTIYHTNSIRAHRLGKQCRKFENLFVSPTILTRHVLLSVLPKS